MVSVVQSPFIVLYVHVHVHNLALLTHMYSLQLFHCCSLSLLNLAGANEKVLEEVSETTITEQETWVRGKLFFSSLFHLFLKKCDYIEYMLVTSGVMMTSTKKKTLCSHYNQQQIMSELLGAIGKDPGMTNPFWPVF